MKKTFTILNFTKLVFLLLALLCVNEVSGMQNQEIIPSKTIQLVDGEEYYFHAVRHGHTLYSISKAYGVSQDDIIKANPEIKYGLKYNQMIKIPVLQNKDKQEIDYIEHEVKRKETLYGISKQYEIAQETILEHNPKARKGLKTKQILKIPVKKEPDENDKTEVEDDRENFIYYTANKGDTPYGISRLFDLPMDTLAIYNPDFLDGVSAGQKIIIPRYKYLQQDEKNLSFYNDSIIDAEKKKKDSELLYDEEYCNDPVLKDHYNVALMIPLFLEEITDEDLDSKKLPLNHPSFAFLQFYEGVMIALDSIESSGVDFTVHVFDVCEDSHKALKAVNSKKFSEMDIIIGPFFEESLKKVAYYAERNNIALISPMYSNNEQLKISRNVLQLTPSLELQLQDLADFILSEKYEDQNIVLIHSDQQNVIGTIKWFRDYLNANINRKQYLKDSLNLARIEPYFHKNSYVGEKTSSFYLFNDTLINAQENSTSDSLDTLVDYMNSENIKEVSLAKDSLGTIVNSLDSLRENIVIALVGGNVHVSNVLRELHNYKDTFDVMVFGTPQWRYLESIDLEYFHSLDVHLFAPDFIDYSDKNIQDFILKFRDKYNTEPNSDAFAGVNTAFYFFNALKLYGTEFHKCIGLLNMELVFQNPYHFQKTFGEDGGWENKKSTIITFKDYRMMDVRKPLYEKTSTTSDH